MRALPFLWITIDVVGHPERILPRGAPRILVLPLRIKVPTHGQRIACRLCWVYQRSGMSGGVSSFSGWTGSLPNVHARVPNTTMKLSQVTVRFTRCPNAGFKGIPVNPVEVSAR